MAGSSTSSFTWVPFFLLLPLFINFHYSHPVLAMSEFNKDVKRFGECVKKCNDTCSSAHITSSPQDIMCQCLNFSVSQGEYGFLNHSIAGLKSLHPNNSCHNSIEPLISHLEVMVPSDLRYMKCFLHEKYEPFISPKSFHKKLDSIKECINSNMN